MSCDPVVKADMGPLRALEKASVSENLKERKEINDSLLSTNIFMILSENCKTNILIQNKQKTPFFLQLKCLLCFKHLFEASHSESDSSKIKIAS